MSEKLSDRLRGNLGDAIEDGDMKALDILIADIEVLEAKLEATESAAVMYLVGHGGHTNKSALFEVRRLAAAMMGRRLAAAQEEQSEP